MTIGSVFGRSAGRAAAALVGGSAEKHSEAAA
jgi:hypothetical protein